MDPIDYTMQVADPIQMALKGYADRVAMQQQDRQLGMEQQRIDLAQQAFQAEQAQIAQQQQAAAAQEAAQRAFADYVMDPNKTYEKTKAVVDANPQLAEAVMSQWKGMNEAQQAGTATFAKQLSYALGTGNTDAAKAMLSERAEAARNAGNEPEAAAYQSQLQMLDAGPEGAQAVLGTAMTALYGVLGPEDMKTHSEMVFGPGSEVTDSVKTLQQRAEMAGLDPGTKEYAEFMLNGGKASGFAIRTNPDGTIEIAQGTDSADIFGGKPPTEGQLAGAGFLQRMTAAEEIFADLEASGVTALPTLKGPIVGTALEGYGLSGAEQQLLQAQRDWVRSKLRKESGAVIGDEEMASEIKTYFPMPGDDPKTIAQKRAARLRASRQMEITAGPAAVLAKSEDQEEAAPAQDDAAIIAEAKAIVESGGQLTPEMAAAVRAIMAKGNQ